MRPPSGTGQEIRRNIFSNSISNSSDEEELAVSHQPHADDLKKAKRLSFMLSQLRDDLGDLIDGLESKSLPYDVAVTGAKVQLTWVLNELSES